MNVLYFGLLQLPDLSLFLLPINEVVFCHCVLFLIFSEEWVCSCPSLLIDAILLNYSTVEHRAVYYS